ncbi:hypothetical protein [Kamptonema sp. UHCC 0994]|uniref:hypothetical protein n=1 Tax=Kamptonema sp. UHCC 0994 TaxID=3031329 RepID=UPI0023B93338|nr:hypothetical protein [Kamptonema sp. UHCC 0994]MDF0552535.1 hypothetical protein [Kamptonema sp. UHCC 0994]
MKFYKALTICLLFFPLLFCQLLPQLSMQNAMAETQGEKLPWDKLYEKEPPRKEETGGSRGAVELCTISPESLSGEEIRIWSDRPLFIWQGNVSKIQIRRRRTGQVLWSQKLTANNNSVMYSGPPLQPGESYDWVLLKSNDDIDSFQVSFQVIPAEERDRITADLNKLEKQLQQEGATPEKIAYAKANYFAERQMWPDVLQSAYEVKNPSEALTKFIQKIPQQFCKPLATIRM